MACVFVFLTSRGCSVTHSFLHIVGETRHGSDFLFPMAFPFAVAYSFLWILVMCVYKEDSFYCPPTRILKMLNLSFQYRCLPDRKIPLLLSCTLSHSF